MYHFCFTIKSIAASILRQKTLLFRLYGTSVLQVVANEKSATLHNSTSNVY